MWRCGGGGGVRGRGGGGVGGLEAKGQVCPSCAVYPLRSSSFEMGSLTGLDIA